MSDLSVFEDLYDLKGGDRLFVLHSHDRYLYYLSGEHDLLFERDHVYNYYKNYILK